MRPVVPAKIGQWAVAAARLSDRSRGVGELSLRRLEVQLENVRTLKFDQSLVIRITVE